MRTVSKAKLAALGACVLYFALTFLYVCARAFFPFDPKLHTYEGSMVPREHVIQRAESATLMFRIQAALVGVGLLFLASVVVWVFHSPPFAEQEDCQADQARWSESSRSQV